LAAYIRYGVDGPVALHLAVGGVRSRRLCTSIAAAFSSEVTDTVNTTPRSWLGTMSVAEWRQRFGSTTAELRNLVEYARRETSGVSEALLTGGTAEVPLVPRVAEHPRSPAVIRPASHGDFAEVDVWCGDQLVGAIPAPWWADVQVLLDSGISFSAEAAVAPDGASLWLLPEALVDDADY
jgi:hypothetical protein